MRVGGVSAGEAWKGPPGSSISSKGAYIKRCHPTISSKDGDELNQKAAAISDGFNTRDTPTPLFPVKRSKRGGPITRKSIISKELITVGFELVRSAVI